MTDHDLHERIITWQPDLYQRYELLRRVLHAAFDQTAGRIRVIDVGSGPERLTEQTLGEGFDVVRTDVGDFDDADIVKIIPGAPLPFDDNSADVVVAMDVLEHVPEALRSGFIDECARVASHLLVLACPTDSEDVRAAELEAGRVMATVSGRPVAFLDEHAAYGLPETATVEARITRWCTTVATAANAPLTTWASSNVIDFVLNLRTGESGLKSLVNQAINERSIVCPTDLAGYREFFLGSPSGTVDVRAIVAGLAEGASLLDGTEVAGLAAEILAETVQELRADVRHLEERISQDAGKTRALDLQIEARTASLRQLERANEQLRRARASSDEQAEVARRQAVAARRERDEAEQAFASAASAEQPTPAAPATPPLTLRRVAGKARRSPRWAARQVRARYSASPPEPAGEQIRESEEQPPSRFDRHWYLMNNPDVRDAGIDPWAHYRHHGRFEGRSPHPLFDRAWYVATYPDSCGVGSDPFMDWASEAGQASRNPNEFFDVAWYVRRHPEVAEAGLDPVEHYRLHGWREGRKPSPLFDPDWYLGTYPDVKPSDADPLTHYVNTGRSEGRHANHLEHAAATGRYRPPDGLIPWFSPVKFNVDAGLADRPRLNVLVPGLGIRHMTGGPNTAIQLAYRLAALGQPVRFISTDAALDDDTGPLWAHMASISEVGRRLPNVEIVDGSNRFRGVAIGENDLFMATAWWTAQSIKAALPLVRHQRFVYLIQDFEPLFFASSSQYALALETYELDHIPVVNSQLLLDHLAAERVGRFADPDFVGNALVFEPTVDRNVFRPQVPTAVKEKRRLLFYARPQNGLRNLFELGVAAIQLAVQQEVFDEVGWEFLGMGDQFVPVAVGPRSVLNPAPWKDFASYAEQMRESDVLLSLMLAPHPSYPPLEMAACGGPAVTTVFGPKTREKLAEISPNIIGTEATIEAIAQGLADAVDRLDDLDGCLDGSTLGLPATWGEVFESVLPELEARLEAIGQEPPALLDDSLRGPPNRYAKWLQQRIAERAADFPAPELDGQMVFSLMTAVWNTPPEFLQALADSVLGQDLPEGWEWIIVDNGSTNTGTIEVLEQLQQSPNVDIQRVESNLGILGGLRACLERARGRYVLHVDHDDLLTKDALRVVAARLSALDWPKAFYSDEDKVLGTRALEPYLKPDWDPVLFSNSCYVAHLCGVDRERALELGAYLDPATEASPDWDLFTRFANAGEAPLHIAEVLYSWRIHASSTASNPGAKPYALATHRRVLERFIEARSDFEHFDIEVHPDSPDRLDWWIRRRHVDARPLVSVVIGEPQRVPFSALPLVDHEIHVIGTEDLDELVRIVRTAAEAGALVHLLNASAQILRPMWYWEALGIFELHDDVAIVGGPIVRSDRIHSAGDVFGFGPTGWGSPATGEPHDGRGWFSQNLKQRSIDGVAADHAVFDARRLQEVLEHDRPQSVSTLGAEFCLHASELGWRVVYSPLLRADVPEPFDEAWTPQERVAIGRRAALLASGKNRSASLSLEISEPGAVSTEPERAAHLQLVLANTPEPSISYHDWLTAELATRGERYTVPDEPPSIAIITPVYIGTDAALFAELATSLKRQSYPFHEWIVGLDGDITDELRAEIDVASANLGDRLRLAGGPKGGILATMRSCLDVATADYIVPVDADDLLTEDALAILVSTVGSEDGPDLVHSDEDVLDGDQFRDPFVRPDWDPVLHLAGSYVWHALCFRRETALEVGLYDDPEFEWCHDWDTVERIRRAGGAIVHVPEVLYHWRRHTGSSTNTDAPETAQQGSVRAMFDRMAADTGHPERYETAEFPLWRGATEFHLRRLHHAPPKVSLVSFGPLSGAARTTVVEDAAFPFHSVHEGPRLNGGSSDLIEVLQGLEADLVWLLDGTTLVGGLDPIWEAVKWIELVPDVVAVCGRSIDEKGIVTSGAERFTARAGGNPKSPLIGKRCDDPGPYALALKPQSADRVDLRNVVADRTSVLTALKTLEPNTTLQQCEAELTRRLHERGGRLAYTPLLTRLASSSNLLAGR